METKLYIFNILGLDRKAAVLQVLWSHESPKFVPFLESLQHIFTFVMVLYLPNLNKKSIEII